MKIKILLLFLLTPLIASATDLKVSLSLAVTNIMATNRTVYVQPLTVPTATASATVIGSRLTFTSDTNGIFYISNIVQNVLYAFSVQAPPSRSDFMVWIKDTDTGLIQAQSNMVASSTATFPAGAVAWSAASSDLRYARAATAGLSNAYSGTFTGLVAAASGSVISNSFLFGGLAFRPGAEFDIGQQQVLDGGGPNAGGIRVVDGDLGGEVDIEGGAVSAPLGVSLSFSDGVMTDLLLNKQIGNLQDRTLADASGLLSVDWTQRRLYDAAGDVVFDWSTATGGGRFILSASGVGTNISFTNLTTFANGNARVQSTGHFQSDPGSSLTLGTGHNFVAGNIDNTVGSTDDYNAIGGGNVNTINPIIGHNDVIAGGGVNSMRGITPSSVSYSSIGGGLNNVIETNSGAATEYATIPGGRSNYVNQSYGFAAGWGAQAIHQGAFVWADSQGTVFSSFAANTFNVRAQNGTWISDGLSFGTGTNRASAGNCLQGTDSHGKLIDAFATNHLTGKSYALVAANTTAFWAPHGNAVTNIETSDVDMQSRQAMGTGFQIVGLWVKSSSAPSAGQTYTATVMTNGVATAVVGTISGASATTASDFAHATAVNAQGDSIGIKIVSSASATSSRYDWDILYLNK